MPQGQEKLSHSCIISAASMDEAVRRAQELARAAVCSGTGPKPCGQCRDCRKAAAGVHPDVITVSRPEDSQGRPRREITVDQIRALSADALLLPNEAENKVYIIRDADKMNLAAQNAALKLLEEPPRSVRFFLCVTNAELLLPTVRSRCTELYDSCGETAEDEESAKRADSFLKTVAEGDRGALLRWCCDNEGIDNRTALAFNDAVAAQLTDMLAGTKPDRGLERGQLLELGRLNRQCADYLRVNTGVKHVFGLLAVDAPLGMKDNK